MPDQKIQKTHTHIHFFLFKKKFQWFPSHSNFQTIWCFPMCFMFSFCYHQNQPTTNQPNPPTTTTGVPNPDRLTGWPVDLTSSSSFSQRLAGRPKRFVKASSKVSTSKANTSLKGQGAAGWEMEPRKTHLYSLKVGLDRILEVREFMVFYTNISQMFHVYGIFTFIYHIDVWYM